ncbi:MAG: hypothetical protein JO199_10415 [Candidatus Eremiobacteraeota bacterium]|nr:hypothetical protein [Candidatus Eremiobacteraeota bacterium]
MVYVEWMRVLRTLRVTAIVMGVLLVLALAGRVIFMSSGHNALSWVARMQSDPGSKVVETTLPDGTHRVTIDTPDKEHIVMDDRGPQGTHIEIYDPNDKGPEHSDVTTGSIQVRDLPSHRGRLTIVDTNGQTDFLMYVIFGTVVAFIVATVLGMPFARENEGHLEIAFLRPASRLSLAVQTIAIDCAGIVAALILGVVTLVAAHAMFEPLNIAFGSSDPVSVGLGIVSPLSVYAVIAAATASMKRGAGVVLGVAWPVMIVVALLAAVPANVNALLTAIHYLFGALSIVDPVTYMHFGAAAKVNGHSAGVDMSDAEKLAILTALAAAYLTAAVVQWRRVEA